MQWSLQILSYVINAYTYKHTIHKHIHILSHTHACAHTNMHALGLPHSVMADELSAGIQPYFIYLSCLTLRMHVNV